MPGNLVASVGAGAADGGRRSIRNPTYATATVSNGLTMLKTA
jgi:hypothetical protein